MTVKICLWEFLSLVLLVHFQYVYSSSLAPRSPTGNPEEQGEYFEGDIMSKGRHPAMDSRAGIINARNRWTSGIIPYQTDPSYPQDLKNLLKHAMGHISQRTCIKFVERTDQKDYIYVQSGKGCSSYVGKIGGKQSVSLPSGCKSLGVFAHELIHAIGFFHEQSRTDRDDFVRINWNNIKPGTQQNFQKYGNTMISPFGVQYDYNSIMHYSSRAFSKNRMDKTIEPLRAGVEIGQRRGMSQGDINKIKNMYCKN